MDMVLNVLNAGNQAFLILWVRPVMPPADLLEREEIEEQNSSNVGGC